MTTQTKDLEQLITGGFAQINNRLDTLENRVVALEQSGPVLKTRLVGFNGNGQAAPAANGHAAPGQPLPPRAVPRTAIIPRHDDDEGEDDAIAAGSWAKVVKKNRCNRVSLTKTRNRDSWKLILSMPGRRRPATFIAWDGAEEALTMFSDVMPELSLENFDQGSWERKDRGGDRVPIIAQWDASFMVEWYQTAPNAQGKTFINVETVYPLYEEE